jgi:hypothetical protein
VKWEPHVRVVGQPGRDLRRGVGREVVQHDVNILARMRLYGLLQKRQEMCAVAGRRALAQDLAGAHVQRGEQVRSAVANVVMGAFLGCVEVNRQQWLGPVQCLDLGFLVDREHHRTAGRGQIQPDDVGDLLSELRVLADLERAVAMGLDPVVPPEFRDVVVRDGNTFGAGDERGHLPARPMRQPSRGRRAGAAECQDPGADRRRDLLASCTPRPVEQARQPLRAVAVNHRSTVGRDTLASTATAFFCLPSAHHSTIRALVATVAATSGLYIRACNSARCSAVNSTESANTMPSQPNVNQTESQDTSRTSALSCKVTASGLFGLPACTPPATFAPCSIKSLTVKECGRV